MPKINIGDTVLVPEPKLNDGWLVAFYGKVIDIDHDLESGQSMAIVEIAGHTFEIVTARLTRIGE